MIVRTVMKMENLYHESHLRDMKQLKSFVIIGGKSKEWQKDLSNQLEKEMNRILSFFEVQEFKEPKQVRIWENQSEYQKYLEQYVPKYYDWMIMDTFDGNINVLDYEECKKTNAHKNMTIEEYQKNIIHELVHATQQEINPNSEGVEWFWEALATNLANPYDHVVQIIYSKDELMYHFNDLKFNYETAYTLGKFMLESYPHEKILEMVKNPSILIADTNRILTEGRDWFNQNYLLLPPTPKAENENFVIYASDSLSQFATDTLDMLTKNQKRILDFFGVSHYRKVQVNLYDNQETFLRFLKSIRPKKSSIPSYCVGTFDNFMINSSIDGSTLLEKYKSKLKSSLHEWIHIIYNDCITDKRVLWLDEGFATNLSGDRSRLDDDEKFKEFIQNRILKIPDMPNMNDLTHGKKFVTETYNGYDLSYFVVRYLLETMSQDRIRTIIKDSQKTEKLGKTILSNAIQYYVQKYNLS